MKNLSLYSDWVEKTCAEKNIRINGELKQLTDGKLFCISSDTGDLYLKKTTNFLTDELTLTINLMEAGIISLPVIIGYNRDMNLCLMLDMGGSDLSLLPSLDMEAALDMFVSLSRIQKASVQFVKSENFCGFDYKVSTMLEELKDMSESSYKMLYDTQYRLTQDEAKKIKQNTEYVKTVLESVNNTCLPDTIHHGDLGMYNVRVTNGGYIFYDWGCGGVSHPFFDTFRLLSSILRKLPTDIPTKEIILDAYLKEWSDYGSCDEIKNIFTAIDSLAGFYMAYCKYIRAWNLHNSYDKKPDLASSEGSALEIRYATTATYLKRFIEREYY